MTRGPEKPQLAQDRKTPAFAGVTVRPSASAQVEGDFGTQVPDSDDQV